VVRDGRDVIGVDLALTRCTKSRIRVIVVIVFHPR